MCKYQATILREFDENIVRVDCTAHNNVVMDTVVPDSEINQFLAIGKDLKDSSLIPAALFSVVVTALDDAGHDVASFKGN